MDAALISADHRRDFDIFNKTTIFLSFISAEQIITERISFSKSFHSATLPTAEVNVDDLLLYFLL